MISPHKLRGLFFQSGVNFLYKFMQILEVTKNKGFLKAIIKILLILLLILWCGVFLARKIDLTNSDIGRHLKNGQLLTMGTYETQESILLSNVYSYTHPNYPFVNHHWGAGIVFYSVWSVFGFVGLSLVYIMLCIAGFLLVFFIAWKESSFWPAYATAIVAVPLIGLRYEIRPEMVTYLFLPIIFWILWSYRLGRISCYWLFVILPALAIWVNFNLYFIFGIYLIGLFWIDSAINYLISIKTKNNPKKKVWNEKLMFISVIGVGGLLATMLNPWGIRGVFYPFFINSQIDVQVFELISPFILKQQGAAPFGFESYFILLAILCIFLLLLIFKPFRGRFSFVIFSWTITLIILSVAQARNVALFGLFSIPLLSIMGKATWKSADNLLLSSGPRIYGILFNKKYKTTFIVVLILFLYSLMFSFNNYHLLNKHQSLGVGLLPDNTKTLNCIKNNSIEGPIFNDFDISSLLIFELFPRQRIFVDHRPEAYPKEFFSEVLHKAFVDEAYWKQIESEYGIRAIVITNDPSYSKINMFANKRTQDPLWDLVCKDEHAYVFKRIVD